MQRSRGGLPALLHYDPPPRTETEPLGPLLGVPGVPGVPGFGQVIVFWEGLHPSPSLGDTFRLRPARPDKLELWRHKSRQPPQLR